MLPTRRRSSTDTSGASGSAHVADWIDPNALLRVRSLEMRARMVVEGFLSGLHRSPYHGFSVEFSEYRQYSPGDDLRYLDWRLFARSDRYYVKRFEDETNVRVVLLTDMSRSMEFGTPGYSKWEYARTMAATLALFLIKQRDAVGVLTFDAEVGDYVPPRFRPGQLHRTLVALERPLQGKATNFVDPFEQIRRTLTKRGILILLSDLLAPSEMLDEQLSLLRAAGHEVIVWRVLDPAELSLEFERPTMFVDLENGRRMYVDPESARRQYRERFDEHAAQLEATCRGLGIDFETFSTNSPFELGLFHYLSTRGRRGGKPLQRKTGAPRMSFLTPLYMLGGLAIAVPVLLHLIRRIPKGEIAFSSLMFLTPSPPRLTRRSRIEHWLLLALRALAVILLAMAFARPFLRGDFFSSQPAGPGRIVALVVDTSASMRRNGVWQETQRSGQRVLDDLGPTDRVALFAFDDQLRTVVDFAAKPTADALRAQQQLVRQQLADLKPTYRGTRLDTSLTQVADRVGALADSDDETLEIYLISDLQRGAALAELENYPWPQGLRVTATAVAASPDNASVQILADREDAAMADRFVRIRNQVDSPKDSFQFVWETVSGKRGVGALQQYVPAGATRVIRFEQPLDDDPLVSLALQGDGQLFDNTYYVAPLKRRTLPIVYLGDDSVDDLQGTQFYLARALAKFGNLSPEVIPCEDEQELASLVEEKGVRLIVVTRPLEAATAEFLREFTENGNSVWLVLTRPEVGVFAGELLEATLEVEEGDVNDYRMLGDIDFLHPLFAAFADPEYSDFTKIRFWKHRSLQVPSELPHDVLARFDDGSPAMLLFPRGSGFVLVWTSSWRPLDSQLAVSSKFVPLVYELVKYYATVPEMPRSYTVGDEVALESGSPGEVIEVVTPAGAIFQLDAADTRFTETDRPGLYRIVGSSGWEMPFAVNLAASESRTEPIDVSELAKLGVPVEDTQEASHRERRQVELKDMEYERRQQLWRWAIAAVVVLLILETALAGRYARQARLAEGT